MQSYRLKCRNKKCGGEFLRPFSSEEFDKLQYGPVPGIACYNCGFPKMITMKSGKLAKDGFQPGYQPNIRKHCATYGQYKAELKRMGLIEIGYDELPENEEAPTQYFTDEVLRKIYTKQGISLDSREADHLKGKI